MEWPSMRGTTATLIAVALGIPIIALGVAAMMNQTQNVVAGEGGCQWVANALPTDSLGNTAKRIFGFSANDAWAASGSTANMPGHIDRWDGATWTTVKSFSDRSASSVWGLSAYDVWVGSRSASGTDLTRLIHHWNGNAWVDYDISGVGATGVDVRAFWGASTNDVWAGFGVTGGASTTHIMHWNGVAWSAAATTNQATINGMWGFAANDVYAGTSSGVIEHFDGSTWTATTPAPMVGYAINAFFGKSGSDFYAAASKATAPEGAIFHWDGATWTTAFQDATEQVKGIHGGGQQWAAGEKNILFLVRDTWTLGRGFASTDSFFGKAVNLQHIWVADAEHVLAINNNGYVLHLVCAGPAGSGAVVSAVVVVGLAGVGLGTFTQGRKRQR